MSQLHFRPAVMADIPAMAAIRLAVRENALTNPARITTQMYEDYLQRLGRGWVCEQISEQGVDIIGFSYAALADGTIWALFVSPDKEGQGAGAPLLKLATDWLFSQGHACVTLGTEADTRADRFYLAQGWTRGEMKDEDEVFYTLLKPTA